MVNRRRRIVHDKIDLDLLGKRGSNDNGSLIVFNNDY